MLLLKLLIAHLIGDFFLQRDGWIKDKEKKGWRSTKLLAHVLVHGVLVSILILTEDLVRIWWILPVIMITHWMIDALKLQFQGKSEKKRTTWFIGDQLAHVLILMVLWVVIEDKKSVFEFLDSELFWLTCTSILFLTQPAAMIVRVMISGWNPIPDKKEHSLANAGKYIGILERLFVFGFVVSGNWEGIGFLLAAKSVFRFGDLNDAKDRNLTEYVLIGTLISFGLAIVVGVLFNNLF